jgi:integrase
MKIGEEHLVPLARQAIVILREIEPITGGGRYVFPSLRGGHRPISENTVNVALRSVGYSGEQITGHGFRAMASTCLNEQRLPPDSSSCSWRTVNAMRYARPIIAPSAFQSDAA